MVLKTLKSLHNLVLVLASVMCVATPCFGAVQQPQLGANLNVMQDVKYPPSTMVIDVTKEPYNAKGDGVHDDTEAIQKALSDMMGLHRLLYFPEGTYLISKTLQWSKKNSVGNDAWGKNFLCGENVNKTKIKLKDGTFNDPKNPMSMMWCGGFGSADWFHNYVENITFDVGANNAGAVGLQFYSNNSGAVRNCRFVARGESGVIGLDLAHRDMNGPLLVQNCEVIGFDRGISTARAVNGHTFEHITLRNQRQFGFDNEGQSISLRSLLSENSIPAVRSYGTFCLLDAKLTGTLTADRWPAIFNYNGGRIFVRDVVTSGYSRAIADVSTPDWFAGTRIVGEDKPGSLGPSIDEYCSHSATTAFSATETSLRLAVKEPPQIPSDPVSEWANVDDFGADSSGQMDSSRAIQKSDELGSNDYLPARILRDEFHVDART